MLSIWGYRTTTPSVWVIYLYQLAYQASKIYQNKSKLQPVSRSEDSTKPQSQSSLSVVLIWTLHRNQAKKLPLAKLFSRVAMKVFHKKCSIKHKKYSNRISHYVTWFRKIGEILWQASSSQGSANVLLMRRCVTLSNKQILNCSKKTKRHMWFRYLLRKPKDFSKITSRSLRYFLITWKRNKCLKQ